MAKEEKKKDNYSFDEKRVSTDIVKCLSCGANMIFNPDKGVLYCSHCGTEKTIEDVGLSRELNLLDGFSDDAKWSEKEANAFKCDNCGATVVLDKSETATVCPFCGTAHVKKKIELNGLKPNAVLPFSFNGDKALEYAKKWAKKKFFAPRRFKKDLQPKNVNGVYSPCFTFDSYTTSTYDGKIGTTHTRTVGSGKNQRIETYTVWRHISGTYYYNFDDMLITAGEKLGQKQVDKTSPYDTNNSKVYSNEYLMGFMAYSYDRELTDCWGTAKKKMDDNIRSGILNQYVHDKVAYLNVSTEHERTTYKYVMLPLYVGNFNYSKKVYNFYINGTTGKTFGKTPVSVFKVLALIFGIIAVACLFYYLSTL